MKQEIWRKTFTLNLIRNKNLQQIIMILIRYRKLYMLFMFKDLRIRNLNKAVANRKYQYKFYFK